MKNPYKNINWQSVLRIGSATHMHMRNQEAFDNGYKYGIRHFPISNYYPSAPYDANTRISDFRLRQHWQEAFEGMLTHLKYPDAGGITINHPTWFSQLTDDQVFEMLDFDSRVLGIEIYSDYSARRNWIEEKIPHYRMPNESEFGFSLKMWDRILSTGRKCSGFCAPDHSVESPVASAGTDTNRKGRNILLVPAFTEIDCLKTYRQGQFYGCLKDNGLTVERFTATNASITVETNGPARFKFTTEAGLVGTVSGKSAVYELPQKSGVPDLTYARVEIEDDTGERLFLQPVMYET